MNKKKDFWKDDNYVTENETMERALRKRKKEIAEDLPKEIERIERFKKEGQYESLFTHYFYDKPNGTEVGICKEGDVVKVKIVEEEFFWGETEEGFIDMMYMKRLV